MVEGLAVDPSLPLTKALLPRANRVEEILEDREQREDPERGEDEAEAPPIVGIDTPDDKVQDQEHVGEREDACELHEAEREATPDHVAPRDDLRREEEQQENEEGLQDHRSCRMILAMPTEAQRRLRTAKLYLLLTRSLCRADPRATLEAALDGGVDVVQIREKPLVAGDRAWIEEVVATCHAHGALAIVNDDASFLDDCDGLHLGQGDLAAYPEGAVRQALPSGHDKVLGISTHDLDEVARALVEAPDYFGIGPCFATATKGYERGLTPAGLAELVAATADRPAFAIGGITPDNVTELVRAGVERIAVSSCILAAMDPRSVAARLQSALTAG